MGSPNRPLVFGAYEINEECPLHVKRRLAALHQIHTTHGLASIISERISLLLDRIKDEEEVEEQSLLSHIIVLLEECGITAEEGIAMCFVPRF